MLQSAAFPLARTAMHGLGAMPRASSILAYDKDFLRFFTSWKAFFGLLYLFMNSQITHYQ